MDRERVLIVEDDRALAGALDAELRRIYDTRVAHTGRDALAIAADERFDLVVLDLNLPDMDGIEVAEALRTTTIKILMVTARADVRSRITGLYAGADDYLAKPFEMQELLARVYVQLRRRELLQTHSWGPIRISEEEGTCLVDGEPLALTPLEFRLLTLLIANQGRLYGRGTLVERLYEEDDTPVSNAVEALVSRLRAKLSEAGVTDVVQNVRGLGYVVRERSP